MVVKYMHFEIGKNMDSKVKWLINALPYSTILLFLAGNIISDGFLYIKL